MYFFIWPKHINAGNQQPDSETTFERPFCWQINGDLTMYVGWASQRALSVFLSRAYEPWHGIPNNVAF